MIPEELGKLVGLLEESALFWLEDYSGGKTARGMKDTPIYGELVHILDAKDRKQVLLIDDGSRFGTDPTYPTIEDLREFILSKRENVSIVLL